MLLVKTYLDKSSIEGIGLFASEFIPEGQRIWEFNPLFDRKITKEYFKKLPEVTQDFIKIYAYYSEESDTYILGCDNDRFFNHSEDPNTSPDPNTLVEGETVVLATRDILEGEELTADYRSFDRSADQKLI